MVSRNSQEEFWVKDLATTYVESNPYLKPKDAKLAEKAWSQMLSQVGATKLESFLECGSNIGRNIQTLSRVLPNTSASVIEINPLALEKCKLNNQIKYDYLGSIKDSFFPTKFDLVFSCGVLIHINPDDLLETVSKMFELSNQFVIIAEYFNRTPISITYRGEDEKLFKRDWGKFVLENFPAELITYGFLWGHEYDAAGFDDITYWVFQKST
jgi:pseudaminic acid biosynthesis-associated methylase